MNTLTHSSFRALWLPFLIAGGLLLSGCGSTAPIVGSVSGPDTLEANETGSFEAEIDNEDDADTPVTYEWAFGDGESASGLSATHAYGSSGEYTVRFSASNEGGADTSSTSVTVVPEPVPASIASLNADPNPVDEGETVRFSANVEGDSPLSYDWSFGDGSSASSESPTHTYDEPGEYTVRLNASNDEGEDSRSVTVEVERDLPEVCMSVSEMNAAFFDRNSSTLTDEAEEELEENAEILSDCPNVSVRIEGFAAPGERDAESLSEDRADAVAAYYEDNDVPSDRITTSGEGQVEDVTSKKDGTQEYRRADSIPEREDDDM
ncbi:MAG: PKD domain-containing protein [Salinivenus sp.]